MHTFSAYVKKLWLNHWTSDYVAFVSIYYFAVSRQESVTSVFLPKFQEVIYQKEVQLSL